MGLLILAVSALPIVAPGLISARTPERTIRAAQLPQPSPIISPENFPPPLLAGNQQLAREPANVDGWSIKLPELGIDLPIVQGDGASVPYYKAAHYPTTAWPGDGNRSFLYAHAQYGPPVMFGPLLDKGRIGLDVWVYRPGENRLHYVIQQFYPAVPYTDLSWLQPTNHEELILMTCTSWTATDPRVIAVAEAVP